MSRKKSDCGEACRKLNDRENKVHLLSLAGHTGEECWRLSSPEKAKQPSKATCQTSGPRMLRMPQLIAAIAHHREIHAADACMTRQLALEALTELANAKPDDEPTHRERLAAIKQLGDLEGWEAPKKFEIADFDEWAAKVKGEPESDPGS